MSEGVLQVKLLFKYKCGHEKMRDIDGRKANNRSIIDSARDKVYDAHTSCPGCNTANATAKIDSLNEAQLRDLVHSLQSHRCVRDALKRF